MVFVWPQNLTRQTRDLILPDTTTTVLAPSLPGLLLKPPLLLVVVCSGVANEAQRAAIRDSWAREELTPDGVAVVFLLGQLRNASVLEDAIEQESSLYGDLVQERFVDNYANLTVKSLMMLKWYTRHFGGKVPYLLKADDDVYVNLRYLHALLVANRLPNLILGSLICGAGPIRDPHNKWYAPEYMYSGAKTYPNYVSGTAYLLSLSAARLLLEAALETPVFHLEDIYVTGILAREVGIRPRDHPGFSYVRRAPNACLYAQSVSSHHLTPQQMTAVADMMVALEADGGQKKCRPLKRSQRRPYGPGKCKWQ